MFRSPPFPSSKNSNTIWEEGLIGRAVVTFVNSDWATRDNKSSFVVNMMYLGASEPAVVVNNLFFLMSASWLMISGD